MNVHIYRGNRHKVIDWCKQHFDDIIEVRGPTIAALHRVAYDPLDINAVVLYFSDDADYIHFLLKWS